MAIQLNAFPFDSQIVGYGADGLPEYDRASNSLELATLIRSFWRNGVFGTGALTVMAGDGMTVTVSTGSVLVQGRVAHIVSQKTLAIDGPSSNPRFDRVVVRCDLSNAVRDLVLDVKKGNPAVSPIAPALTRNESVWEICLATIRITEGATSVSQSMITDTRTNSNLCGIVAATMTEVDTDRFYAQVQSDLESFRAREQTTMSTFFAERRREFDAWFADVKNILNDSAATKLTAQLMEKASVNSEIVSISPSRWTGGDGKYSQRVSCSIAKNEESNVYVVSPVPTSIDEYSDCGIYASEYGDSYIIFSAKDKPDNTLMANVIQIEKGWSSGATINSFAPPVEETVSGSVAHTDIAAERPVVELISHIEPVQAGSGDPSLDNVRTIGGWDSVSVTNDTSGQTLTADLPETVYGGNNNWTIGMVTVAKGKHILDGVNGIVSNMSVNSSGIYYASAGLPTPGVKTGSVLNSLLSDKLIAKSKAEPGCCYITGSSANVLVVTLHDQSLTTADAVNAWLTANPITFVYTLAEPYTIQLTPQQLLTLEKGVNNVWSTTGDTDLTYVADTKSYIDKQLAAIAAATLNN